MRAILLRAGLAAGFMFAVATATSSSPPASPDAPAKASDDQSDKPTRADHEALDRTIRQLILEARADDIAIRLESGQPDYATRDDVQLHPDLLSTAIIKPAHRDPFIDAYIRWQLSSFDPPLPEMDDRAFMSLLTDAPAMVENPMAQRDAVAIFKRAAEAASFSERDLDRLKKLAAELEAKSTTAQTLNTPAIGFRDWVASRLGDAGHRPRLWRLERCAATISAGWPAGKIKGDISIDFRESASDESFTVEQRRAVAAQVERMIDHERLLIDAIQFTAAGGVEVSFQRARVDKDDAAKWIERLAGPASD